jgi:hypothetical protein
MTFENKNSNKVVPAGIRKENGFADPNEAYPKKSFLNAPSVNEKARGTRRVNVELGGGNADLDLELKDEPASIYPNSQVKETASGHIVEYDDTPGAERIMIRHRTGSGVEMRANGTVIYGSVANTIRVTAHDEKVIVDGDGELHYNGNLKLKVAGDFDLEVGGDFNVRVDGDVDQTIKRSYKQDIGKNKEVKIVESRSETIGIDGTTFIHGNSTNTIKKSNNIFVGEDEAHNVGGTLFMTAENEVSLSTKSINATASSLAVLGDSGTIGGTNMVYYGHTARIPRINATSVHASQGVIADVGMTAPTFNGNLSGNASTAGKSAVATALGAGAGSTQDTVTITPAADSDTLEPTTSVLNELLEQSTVAIKRVAIDTFGGLFDRLNRKTHYGGLSTTDLTTRQVRSKLRDPNALNNEKFTNACQAEGVLSAFFTRQSILTTDRIVSGKKSLRIPSTIIGNPEKPTERFKGSPITVKTTEALPEPNFNPVFQDEITSRTRLAPGITMATFLGGSGDPVTLTHILDDNVRLKLAKQYTLHARVLRAVNSYNAVKEFKDFRLQVVEGLYRAEDGEELDVSDGLNFLMSRGRAVVYELINMKGEIAIEKTFDLAVYLKDTLNFEKLILDYDNYNPDGSLNAQIIVIMPEITPPWTVTYKNEVETRYNNFSQVTNELMEALPTT